MNSTEYQRPSPVPPQTGLRFSIRALFCATAVVAVLSAMIGIPLAKQRREAMLVKDLRLIALAMHNYHDVHKCFPPPYFVDADGQPTHSWRVIILPMLANDPMERQIYASYDFSQPWDSPANTAATAVMPEVFRHAGRRDSRPTTDYMAIVGNDTMFDPRERVRFADTLDGTSNTILVVEVAGSNTHWASPHDLRFEDLPLKINASHDGNAISGQAGRGALAAFADGSTHWLQETLDSADLRRMILRNDGERFKNWSWD